MIDLGTGNNNKINWAMEDKQVGLPGWVGEGREKGLLVEENGKLVLFLLLSRNTYSNMLKSVFFHIQA